MENTEQPVTAVAAKGKGKGQGKVGRGAHHSKPVSRSVRAGLAFPVGRIHRFLRKGRYAARIGGGASIYLAAVLEYLTAELIELSGNAAKDNRRARIIPRHIQLAVRNDEDLSKLVKGVTITGGGVPPNVHAALLPKKKTTKKEKAAAAAASAAATVEKHDVRRKAQKTPKTKRTATADHAALGTA